MREVVEALHVCVRCVCAGCARCRERCRGRCRDIDIEADASSRYCCGEYTCAPWMVGVFLHSMYMPRGSGMNFMVYPERRDSASSPLPKLHLRCLPPRSPEGAEEEEPEEEDEAAAEEEEEEEEEEGEEEEDGDPLLRPASPLASPSPLSSTMATTVLLTRRCWKGPPKTRHSRLRFHVPRRYSQKSPSGTT